MPLRDVHTCREVLESAIVDGINQYLREVLLPLGIIKDNDFDLDFAGSSLNEKKYRIAEQVASAWEHCQIDEEA